MQPRAEPEPLSRTRATVLVVDDDEGTREVFEAILATRGYAVALAADGNDGLEQFRSLRPDVTIVDIFMPEKDGLETIRALRQEFPSAKIIAISAGATARPLQGGPALTHILRAAILFGADLVLTKPILPDDLTAAVHRLLRAEGRQA